MFFFLPESTILGLMKQVINTVGFLLKHNALFHEFLNAGSQTIFPEAHLYIVWVLLDSSIMEEVTNVCLL